MQQSCINVIVALAALIALKHYSPELYQTILDIVQSLLIIARHALEAATSG